MLQIICHYISVPANNDDSCDMIGITRKYIYRNMRFSLLDGDSLDTYPSSLSHGRCYTFHNRNGTEAAISSTGKTS